MVPLPPAEPSAINAYMTMLRVLLLEAFGTLRGVRNTEV